MTRVPALQMAGVSKVHATGQQRVHALMDVRLTVAPGEMVAVMGPSGSGKSTLLNLAGGLDLPSSGTVLVNGHPLESMSRRGLARVRRRFIGFVFQDYNLLPSLTALENISLPLELDGRRPREARRHAEVALEAVGLDGLGHRFPRQLSGGQQQRVAIARAVIADRGLVLADEPTGALDSATGEQILVLLRQRCSDGAAVLLVTHEERHALHADRVERLADGRQVSVGAGADADAIV